MAVQVGIAVKNGQLSQDARYEILETLEDFNKRLRRLKEFKVTVDWQAADTVCVQVAASGDELDTVVGQDSAGSVLEALDAAMQMITQQLRQNLQEQEYQEQSATSWPVWISNSLRYAAAIGAGALGALLLFLALTYSPERDEPVQYVVREEATEYHFPIMLMGRSFFDGHESHIVNLGEVGEVIVHETFKNEQDGTHNARISFTLADKVEIETWVKYKIQKVPTARGMPIALYPVLGVKPVNVERLRS